MMARAVIGVKWDGRDRADCRVAGCMGQIKSQWDQTDRFSQLSMVNHSSQRCRLRGGICLRGGTARSKRFAFGSVPRPIAERPYQKKNPDTQQLDLKMEPSPEMREIIACQAQVNQGKSRSICTVESAQPETGEIQGVAWRVIHHWICAVQLHLVHTIRRPEMPSRELGIGADR